MRLEMFAESNVRSGQPHHGAVLSVTFSAGRFEKNWFLRLTPSGQFTESVFD